MKKRVSDDLLERTKKLVELGDINCFLVLTNIGCSINAKKDEILAMVSCLASELKDDIAKKEFLSAIELGYEEGEEIDHKVELINKIKNLMKELEDE